MKEEYPNKDMEKKGIWRKVGINGCIKQKVLNNQKGIVGESEKQRIDRKEWIKDHQMMMANDVRRIVNLWLELKGREEENLGWKWKKEKEDHLVPSIVKFPLSFPPSVHFTHDHHWNEWQKSWELIDGSLAPPHPFLLPFSNAMGSSRRRAQKF